MFVCIVRLCTCVLVCLYACGCIVSALDSFLGDLLGEGAYDWAAASATDEGEGVQEDEDADEGEDEGGEGEEGDNDGDDDDGAPPRAVAEERGCVYSQACGLLHHHVFQIFAAVWRLVVEGPLPSRHSFVPLVPLRMCRPPFLVKHQAQHPVLAATGGFHQPDQRSDR